MKQILLLFSCCVFIFSCKDANNKSSNGGITDSLKQSESVQTSFDSIYPVFEISPNTTAFTVNFYPDETERETILDTIFRELYPANGLYDLTNVPKPYTIFDTSGTYKIFKNPVFEQRAKKYFKSEYYVYGTTGSVKLAVEDVVIAVDECRTSFFAFCFNKNQLQEIGHPLLCSATPINLNYANNYSALERRINDKIDKVPRDYKDSIKTKVFANAGKFFFTYNDDFKWATKKGSECKFPNRYIYSVTDTTITEKWVEGLDLFGISCD